MPRGESCPSSLPPCNRAPKPSLNRGDEQGFIIKDLLRAVGPSTTAHIYSGTSAACTGAGAGAGADAGARVAGSPVRGTPTTPLPPLPHHRSSDAGGYSIKKEGETQPRPSGPASTLNLSLPFAHLTAIEWADTTKLEAVPTSSNSWRGHTSSDSIFDGGTFGTTAPGAATFQGAVQTLGSGSVHRADVRLLDAPSRVYVPGQHLTIVDSVNTDFPEGLLTPSQAGEGDVSFNSLTFGGSTFGAVAPGAEKGMMQSNTSGQVPSLEQIVDFSTLDLRFMDLAELFHATSTPAPHPPLERTQQPQQQQQQPISVDMADALHFLSQATSSLSEQSLHATRVETQPLTLPNSTSPTPAPTPVSPKINPSPLVAAFPHSSPFSTVLSDPSDSSTGFFSFVSTTVSTWDPYQNYVIDASESDLLPLASLSTSSSQHSPSVEEIDAQTSRKSSPAESSSTQATLHRSSKLCRKRCASLLELDVEQSHYEQGLEIPEGVEMDRITFGMHVQDYRALSARERKRVRNRISAKAFRAKRKEHVSSLESTLEAKNLQIKLGNEETSLLRTEVAGLKQRLAKYEKQCDGPIA